MDSTFENFFYQRDYTLKNFNFYLQVLAQQYKDKEAMVAFRKMETMGIKPDDVTFNQLMLAFAKNRNIEMVEQINEEAKTKYGLLPSVQRYNSLIVAYAKSNRA